MDTLVEKRMIVTFKIIQASAPYSSMTTDLELLLNGKNIPDKPKISALEIYSPENLRVFRQRELVTFKLCNGSVHSGALFGDDWKAEFYHRECAGKQYVRISLAPDISDILRKSAYETFTSLCKKNHTYKLFVSSANNTN